MAQLFLPSLKVINFRAFRQLDIEKLGRVNLITGRNSVGKTSLLEALEVYARRADPMVLRSILTRRSELRGLERNEEGISDDQLFSTIRHLLHGRPRITDKSLEFSISPATYDLNALRVKVGWIFRERDAEGPATFTSRWSDYAGDVDDEGCTPGVQVTFGSHTTLYTLERAISPRLAYRSDIPTTTFLFVPVQGLAMETTAVLWDKIALTDEEPIVLDALRVVAPEVERIAFIRPNGVRSVLPIVRIRGVDDPTPVQIHTCPN